MERRRTRMDDPESGVPARAQPGREIPCGERTGFEQGFRAEASGVAALAGSSSSSGLDTGGGGFREA